jgi:hypothetical protein
MGDCGNIVVQEDKDHRVYLYTHWSGSEMPETLRSALVRGKERWSDPQYLARIIFCEMVHSDNGLTGFGITSRVHDNSHPLVVVDCEKQEIRLEPEPDGSHAPGKPKAWTFAAYAALPEAGWGTLDEAHEE